MADLDLKLLRYFLATVAAGSFSSAARQLGITQPALSQGVRRLEDVIGAELLERAPQGSPRPFRLTPAGEVLAIEARQLLDNAARALQRTRASLGRPVLRVGFSTSSPTALTQVLIALARNVPEVELRLVYLEWGDEGAALERGDVDAYFSNQGQVAPVPQPSPVETVATDLCTVPRVAIFSAGHPLTARQTLSIAELDDEPILDADAERDFWIVNPRPSGRRPITVGPRARTVDEMLTFISTGIGMGITCSTVAEKHQWPTIRYVPIRDLAPTLIRLVRLASENRRGVLRLFALFIAHCQGSPGSPGLPPAVPQPPAGP